jgi:DNA-binding response OmpR family regulator
VQRGRENRARAASRGELQAVAEAPEPARRALVVDDDDETREYLRDLLCLCGFEVEAACDARGARALVRRRAPDVMLIDLMMPHENGASLLRDLRAHEVTVPALIVTARDGDAPDVYARELGAMLVRKPFRAADLLDAVTRAVSRLPE